MTFTIWRIARGMTLAIALMVGGTLALSVLPGLVLAQSDSDMPAAACGSGPNVICLDTSDPSGQYIGSITALPDGIVLLLTNAGLDKARECGGAAAIARMAEVLYAMIPEDQRAGFRLDWSSQQVADEIYGHAFLEGLSGGIGSLGSIHERANPINIVFADYGGPGNMTTEAAAEQKVFAALGTVHRAVC